MFWLGAAGKGVISVGIATAKVVGNGINKMDAAVEAQKNGKLSRCFQPEIPGKKEQLTASPVANPTGRCGGIIGGVGLHGCILAGGPGEDQAKKIEIR